ncbi:MAG TPA: carbohydrate kinase family protein [Candidatus Acidoferrum sp.]|nr:carbohydrate kinase family protein [Candidatus Acidoferrum sp.]
MGRKKDSASSLLAFGDLNIDMIGRVDAWPSPGGECLCPQLELHCGGVGANCALAIAPWGIKVRLLGCVGQDRFGDVLIETLRKTGVEIGGVQRSARSLTGILYINVTRDGQRTFFGSRGANQFMGPPHVSASWLLGPAAAHLVGYSFLNPGPEKMARLILRQFHAHGKMVSLDVGMEPCKRIPKKILSLLPQLDLLFVSSEEAAILTGRSNPRESFLQFERAGAREIVIKIGKRGCLISEGRILREVPSFAVRVVDSTGAGDAFTAAFLQARLRGWSTREAALVANAAGAAAASRVGAGTVLSDVAGTLRLLRTQRLKGSWEETRLQILSRVKKARGL